MKNDSHPYRRVLIKLSGEALAGDKDYGLDQTTLSETAKQIADVHKLAVDVAIVLGAGNIYRGKGGEKEGISRVTGDYMGMLATVINALAFRDVLHKAGLEAIVQTALNIDKVAEPYSREKAFDHLKQRRVIIFACGTGNPYFTTDTAAALRAIEIGADVLFKATKVDGIYNKDPELYKDALFYPSITYDDVLRESLEVMDLTAITLCKENGLPLAVFNMRKKGNLQKAVFGEPVGTIVRR